MLDAIAQAATNHAAKPVDTTNINKPRTELIASQTSVVPAPKPAISAPESIPPAFAQSNSMIPQPIAIPAQSPVVPITHVSAARTAQLTAPTVAKKRLAVTELLTASDGVRASASPGKQTTDMSNRDTIKQARVTQRQFLEQRLADIVAKEKPLKEAKLREMLKATAISDAKAGRIDRARQTAQDLVLSPEMQADLLAQINAIEANQLPVKPTSTLKQPHPKQPSALAKATWTPTTVSGRSLPAPLSYTPPQYSYVPQPQYVSYALNGFGRSVGGIGVVVDDTNPEFDVKNWATYATGNHFNAGSWHGLPFSFPLAVPAPITSAFGWRVHPITGDRRFHSGMDLGAPIGTPVVAAYAGKVALSDWLSGYGLAIILSHNNDTQETLYGHLSEVFVKPGQMVEKGIIIGRVGSTGLSTGPHLHFELRLKTPEGWQAIDPGIQLEYALAQLVKAIQAG